MTDTVTITGNVGTEPEKKRTGDGVAITSFRLASPQRRFDRAAGTWVDTGTNWYSVSAFRRLGDHAFESLRKGNPVVVTGRLRIRDWDNGTKKGTDVEIDADAIGHDLRWGTSVYTKVAGPTTPEVAPDGAADAWSTDAQSVGWRAPGEAPSLGEGEPRALEPVGADGPF